MAGYRKNWGSSATRYSAGVSSFGGIDLASDRFKVSSDRAIAALNYIYKDGDVVKRKGYRQFASFFPDRYFALSFDRNVLDVLSLDDIKAEEKDSEGNAFVNPVNVNGIWDFVAYDGKRHVVAHVGHLLYEVFPEEGRYEVFGNFVNTASEGQVLTTWQFLDQRCMAFVGDHRLWFLGGTRFVVISFDSQGGHLDKVEDGLDTYVPTTSISVAYDNAKGSARASLDAVNLMTRWRKNLLVSGLGKVDDAVGDSRYYEYQLDGPIIPSEGKLDQNEDDFDKALSVMDDFSITIEQRGGM